MSVYLASLNESAGPSATGTSAQSVVSASQAARPAAAAAFPRGSRLFSGACEACHSDGSPITSLALNTNLHADAPDNVLRAILEGVAAPAMSPLRRGVEDFGVVAMPAFDKALEGRDLVDLVGYLRARFAPGKPAWDAIAEALAAIRADHH
jgi:nicotinate dehydrogenase subunit B